MEGTTLYCGDNCNHTGPHHYRPAEDRIETIEFRAGPHQYQSGPVITQCPHGLDLRIYPRCFLCRPLVVSAGCECSGPWWAVIPPPCPVHNPGPPTITLDHT